MDRKLVTPWKPSKTQILAVRDKRVTDLAAKDLIVLFAGINPGLYTAAIGCHFGRPGNRFWPALHAGGFTPRLFSPFESPLLLDLKLASRNRSRILTDALLNGRAEPEDRGSERLMVRQNAIAQEVFGARLGAAAPVRNATTAS